MPNYQGGTKEFYAYVHARPDGSIFYVGKGSGNRAKKLTRRTNAHHKNILAKHGRKNILVGVMECSDEATAFELERGLIACLKRMDVSLVNRTEGGEGCVGLVVTEEQKQKISAALKGRPRGPVSKETGVRISAAKTGFKYSAESREKMRQSALGRVASEETRRKLSEAAKNPSLETRAKMSAARSAWWAARKAEKEANRA